MLFQESADRAEPVGNSLGVVNAVDAQAHQHAAQIQLVGQPLHLFGDVAAAGILVDLLEVDADGKGPDQGAVASIVDQAVVEVHLAVHGAVDRVQKVVTVVANVEAQHVVAQ